MFKFALLGALALVLTSCQTITDLPDTVADRIIPATSDEARSVRFAGAAVVTCQYLRDRGDDKADFRCGNLAVAVRSFDKAAGGPMFELTKVSAIAALAEALGDVGETLVKQGKIGKRAGWLAVAVYLAEQGIVQGMVLSTLATEAEAVDGGGDRTVIVARYLARLE